MKVRTFHGMQDWAEVWFTHRTAWYPCLAVTIIHAPMRIADDNANFSFGLQRLEISSEKGLRGRVVFWLCLLPLLVLQDQCHIEGIELYAEHAKQFASSKFFCMPCLCI